MDARRQASGSAFPFILLGIYMIWRALRGQGGSGTGRPGASAYNSKRKMNDFR